MSECMVPSFLLTYSPKHFVSVETQSRSMFDDCTLIDCLDLFTREETLSGDDRPVSKVCRWIFHWFMFYCFHAVGLASEEHPACKNCVMWCWRGYVSGMRCKWFAYGPADATATVPPIISCFIKIQNDLAFLVLTYPGCPAKKGR